LCGSGEAAANDFSFLALNRGYGYDLKTRPPIVTASLAQETGDELAIPDPTQKYAAVLTIDKRVVFISAAGAPVEDEADIYGQFDASILWLGMPPVAPVDDRMPLMEAKSVYLDGRLVEYRPAIAMYIARVSLPSFDGHKFGTSGRIQAALAAACIAN